MRDGVDERDRHEAPDEVGGEGPVAPRHAFRDPDRREIGERHEGDAGDEPREREERPEEVGDAR